MNDYLSDLLISHEFDRPVAREHLRSIVAAPVRVGRTVRAVIYGGVRDGQSIGVRGVESIARIAKDLGFELTVRAEVENRLMRIETHELLAEFRSEANGAARRRIAEAHLDLHDLSQATADQHLRQRIAEIADRLVALERRENRSVRLSPREVDVVSLAALGCGNAEIAVRLGIGAETVKGYLRNVARKLGTHTRSGAVATARRAGYIV